MFEHPLDQNLTARHIKQIQLTKTSQLINQLHTKPQYSTQNMSTHSHVLTLVNNTSKGLNFITNEANLNLETWGESKSNTKGIKIKTKKLPW